MTESSGAGSAASGAPSAASGAPRAATVLPRANRVLLGILFIVWGALTVVVGLSMLALGVSAFALLSSSATPDGGVQFAAGLAAGAFLSLAAIAVIWGAAHIGVGVPLRRRTHWSRLAALMLGTVDLVLLPYGTAIGGYALATLLRDDGKRLFQ